MVFLNGNAQMFNTAWDIGGTGGPFTVAAICQSTSNTGTRRVIVGAGTSSNIATWELILDTTNKIGLLWNGTDMVETVTLTVADGWAIVAATKTAGTTAPRYHKVPLPPGTIVHEADTATKADSAAVDGKLRVGSKINSTTNPFTGHVQAVGVWREVLTDEDIEDLRLDLMRWRRTTLKGLWLFDQNPASLPSADLAIGNAASQSAFTPTVNAALTAAPPPWSRVVRAGLL